MAKFKIIVSDPETGTSKVVELEEARAVPLIGRRLGEIIDGAVVDLPAHKVQIMGGSDKDGVPMRGKFMAESAEKLCLAVEQDLAQRKKEKENAKQFAEAQLQTKLLRLT